MPFLDRHRLPVAGKYPPALLVPPDVLVRVHQLELEVDGRRLATDESVESVIVWQVEMERLAGDEPTGPIQGFEVQPHRSAAVVAGVLSDLETGAVRCGDRPTTEISEIIH